MAKKNSSFFDSRRGMPIDDDTTLYPRETKMLNRGKEHTSKVIDVDEEGKEKYIKEVGVQLDSLKENIEALKERISTLNKRGVPTEEINDHLGRAEGFLQKIDAALGSTFDLDKTAKIASLVDEMEERISGIDQIIEDMEKLNTPPEEKFNSLKTKIETLQGVLSKKKGDKSALEEEIKKFLADVFKENARSVKLASQPTRLAKLFSGFPEKLETIQSKVDALEDDENAKEIKTDDEQKEEKYQKAKNDLAGLAEDLEKNGAKEFFIENLASLNKILDELPVSIKEDGTSTFVKKLNNFNSALDRTVKLVAEFKQKKVLHAEARKVFDVFLHEVRRLGVFEKFQDESEHLEDILENLLNLRNSRGIDAFRVELDKFNSLSEVVADKVAEAAQADMEPVPVEVKAEITAAEKAKIEMRLENAQKRTSLFADVIMAYEPFDIQQEAKLLFIKINNFLSQAESLKDNIIEFDQKIIRAGELLQEIINLVKDETREEFNKQWELMKKRTSKTPDVSVPEPAGIASVPDTSSDKLVLEQAAKLQQCKSQLSFLEKLPQDKVDTVLKKELKNRVKTIKGQITKASKEADTNIKDGLLKNIQDSIFSLFNVIKNSSEGPELLKNLAGLGVDFTIAPDAAPAVPDVVVSAPDTVLTVSADAEDKKEIEHRREMVELREKKFLRHIIDTMSGDAGLAQEIRGVHDILKNALKNIHDADKFEELLNQYEQQAPLLIKKINDESDIITVETSDIVESLDRKVIEKREKEVLDCENELEVVMERVEKGLPDYNFNDELDEINDQIKLALASTADPNEFETHITNLRESVAQLKKSVDEMFAPKKSFWAKTKEKLFGIKEKAVAAKDVVLSKEVGKAVVKAAYDSATSVLGIKLVTDAGRWLINGEGDLADYFKGKKRAGKDQKDIHTAYQNLLASFEKSKKGEALSGGEQVSKRIEQLKAKIENTNLSAEAKKQILERLWAISIKHQENSKKVEASRDQEVKKLLDGYIHSKIEGVKIAKDALNLALTATGLSVLRGIMYAGTSLLEKARKGSKEFAIKTSGTLSTESENTFIKNALVKSAQETVRALRGRGATEGASATTRVIDFIKAAGVVARVFGITKLAFMDGDHNQTMDQLIQGVEKNGWTHIITEVPHNLAANLEKTGQMVGLDRVWNKIAGTEEATQSLGAVFQNSENSSPLNVSDMVSRLEAGSADSVYAFAAEHQLSERSADYLAQFDSLKDHPESLNRILESSHVGAGVRSHFTGSKLDNIIEAGGERRAVIFEELWKNDRAAAINFLNKQGFSRMHLSHFAAFADKKGNVDFVKFVENYNPDDKKMSLALFRAMQGKENTELANAGLVRAATTDHTGRTVRIKGDVMYFGLDEKGEPILSGGGQVAVRETFLNKNNKIVLSASQAKEGLNTDDALWANANTIRDMKSDGSSFEGNTQNVLSELSPKGVKQFMQGEIDKARFAKMGEEHIDAISKPVGSNGQNVNSFDITHLRDKKGMPIERSAFADQSLESPVPENAFNTAPAAKSNREVVGKTVQIFEAGKPVLPETVKASASTKTADAVSAAVAPVDSSAPTKTAAETVFSIEKASPQTEFANWREDYPLMVSEVAIKVTNSTNLKMDSAALTFLNKEFEAEITRPMNVLAAKIDNNIDLTPAEKQKLLEIEQITKAFKTSPNNPDLYKSFSSREMQLMFQSGADTLLLANGGHAFRVKVGDQELFITSETSTFTTVDGVLIEKNVQTGAITRHDYNETLDLDLVKKVAEELEIQVDRKTV